MDAESYLRRSFELAASTMRSGRGGPFGAIIVQAGVVIGEGANRVVETRDPTAHAEIVAIRAACAKLGDFSLVGSTLYASSEPCPMCLAAIYWARVDSIVFATGRGVAASAGFDDQFFYDELAREPAARRVPMRQMELPDGARLFDEWAAKADKVRY